MRDRRTFLFALASTFLATSRIARSQTATPLISRVPPQRFSFSWIGPIEGATQSLAVLLGYTPWARMASGLAIPEPPPVVRVSVGFASATAADIVVALEAQVKNRAIIVLDPANRSVGVVYYG